MKDNPELTLREAFEKFCEKNRAQFEERDVSREAEEFFRFHDTAHVVFGCSTSFFGEGVVKFFTIWGTSLGFWKHLSGYSEADALSLFRQYSIGHLIRNIGKIIIAAPTVFVRTRRMKKKWPWSDHEQFLDMPLSEIRREFNIEVLK